jgi:hypothetical protein
MGLTNSVLKIYIFIEVFNKKILLNFVYFGASTTRPLATIDNTKVAIGFAVEASICNMGYRKRKIK